MRFFRQSRAKSAREYNNFHKVALTSYISFFLRILNLFCTAALLNKDVSLPCEWERENAMNYRYINLLSLPLTKLRGHKDHHKPPMLDTQYEPVLCDIVATDASNNFRYYKRHFFSYEHALDRATSNSNMTPSIILDLGFLYPQILK